MDAPAPQPPQPGRPAPPAARAPRPRGTGLAVAGLLVMLVLAPVLALVAGFAAAALTRADPAAEGVRPVSAGTPVELVYAQDHLIAVDDGTGTTTGEDVATTRCAITGPGEVSTVEYGLPLEGPDGVIRTVVLGFAVTESGAYTIDCTGPGAEQLVLYADPLDSPGLPRAVLLAPGIVLGAAGVLGLVLALWGIARLRASGSGRGAVPAGLGAVLLGLALPLAVLVGIGMLALTARDVEHTQHAFTGEHTLEVVRGQVYDVGVSGGQGAGTLTCTVSGAATEVEPETPIGTRDLSLEPVMSFEATGDGTATVSCTGEVPPGAESHVGAHVADVPDEPRSPFIVAGAVWVLLGVAGWVLLVLGLIRLRR